MLYLLVVSRRNGNVNYYGPFPSKRRAIQYAEALVAPKRDTQSISRWHIADLVKPFAVSVICSNKDEYWMTQ